MSTTLINRASAVCQYCKTEPRLDPYFVRALALVQTNLSAPRAQDGSTAQVVVARNRQYNERAQFVPTAEKDDELELLFAVVGGVEAFMLAEDYFSEWYLCALNEYDWWRRQMLSEGHPLSLHDLIAAEHYIKPSCNDLHSGQRVAFFTDARTSKVREILAARGLVDNQVWAQVSGWQLAGYFQYASTFAEAFTVPVPNEQNQKAAKVQLPKHLQANKAANR